MANRIYLYELEGYKRATSKQIDSMHTKPDSFFDLEKLPDALREEMRTFLIERGNRLSITSITREIPPYKLLCTFISEKEKGLQSFRDKPIKKLEKKLRAWLMKKGYLISYKQTSKVYPNKKPAEVSSIAFLKKLYQFLEPVKVNNQTEQDKDIWILKNLGITLRENPIRNVKTINFIPIIQPEIRKEVKTIIYMELKNVAVGTVLAEMSAIKKFSKFLAAQYPDIQSLLEINREVIESYLIHLNTVAVKKSFRTDLIYIKTIFSLVGKTLGKAELDSLFYTGDIPCEIRRLYRTYTDREMIRLNTHIVQMNEQIARALIIHQMLGTRISDTLTLPPDCLYQKDNRYIIKIRQLKSKYYEKPVSDELAELIQKAAAYTKEHYETSKYLFVSESDPSRPYQYSMIQHQVLGMIRKLNLRDDNGDLFGFDTHLYRHTYGRKLTEMHLDDYTISRLLGHANTSSVKYYRKLSNKALQEETKEMRETMDIILMDIVRGWADFGEI